MIYEICNPFGKVPLVLLDFQYHQALRQIVKSLPVFLEMVQQIPLSFYFRNFYLSRGVPLCRTKWGHFNDFLNFFWSNFLNNKFFTFVTSFLATFVLVVLTIVLYRVDSFIYALKTLIIRYSPKIFY